MLIMSTGTTTVDMTHVDMTVDSAEYAPYRTKQIASRYGMRNWLVAGAIVLKRRAI